MISVTTTTLRPLGDGSGRRGPRSSLYGCRSCRIGDARPGFPERIVAEVGEAQADADRAVTVIITAGVLSVIAGFAYRLSGGR